MDVDKVPRLAARGVIDVRSEVINGNAAILVPCLGVIARTETTHIDLTRVLL